MVSAFFFERNTPIISLKLCALINNIIVCKNEYFIIILQKLELGMCLGFFL